MAHAGQREPLHAAQAVEVEDVAHPDLEEIVEAAGDPVAVEHLQLGFVLPGSKVLNVHLGGVPAINGHSYTFRNGWGGSHGDAAGRLSRCGAVPLQCGRVRPARKPRMPGRR